MNVNLSWEKIILGYTEDITIHRLRNLVITVILYARFKFWLRSMTDIVILSHFKKIVKQDISRWNLIIYNSRFDKNHNVLKIMWSKFEKSFQM